MGQYVHLQNICISVWVLSEVTIFYGGKHSPREPLSYAIHRWHLDPTSLSFLLNLVIFLPVFGISSWLQRSPGLQELHLHRNKYTAVSKVLLAISKGPLPVCPEGLLRPSASPLNSLTPLSFIKSLIMK